MEQHELLKFVIDRMERLQIPYMIVGSMASIFWGEARMTIDADIVIDPSETELVQLCSSFPSEDFYVSTDAAKSALQHRSQFNVIHPESGNKIDFMIVQSDARNRDALARRLHAELMPGVKASIARPEDVILSKMLYYREGQSDKHLRDIAGVIAVSGDKIDFDYLQKWIDQLNLNDVWTLIPKRPPEP